PRGHLRSFPTRRSSDRTTLSLSFDDAGSTGILTAGSITAIGGSIDVRLANGDMVKLNAGETVAATGAKAQDDDDDDDGAGGAWRSEEHTSELQSRENRV